MKSPLSQALVIDDEKNIRQTLNLCLRGVDCSVVAVGDAEAALASAANQAFDLAFLDLRLGKTNGVDLIAPLLAKQPQLPIIVMTAYATLESAVHALKRGATNYLAKPITPAQVRDAHQQCLAYRRSADHETTLESDLTRDAPEAHLSAQAPAMRSLLAMVRRTAPHNATVLLRGETGTGKGVVARLLHVLGARSKRPFVTVNCPSLSTDLLTSELFGHARGAFTGAVRDQEGRVECAEGGTLFLDEVTEMSSAIQARLLRFLQDKAFERLGDNRTRYADVRLIAATNRHIESDIARGDFREDLFYRLNVIEMHVPALRERPEDILPLAHRFLEMFAYAANRAVPELSPQAESALLAYPWPGNVRELRNAMERAVILDLRHTFGRDTFRYLQGRDDVSPPAMGGNFSLKAVQCEHIKRVLARATGQEEAASILGINVSTLWRNRNKYRS